MTVAGANPEAQAPAAMTPGRAALRLGSDARLLPLGVRWFYLQALGTALRRDDRWTLEHAHSSAEVAGLLDAADRSEHVVQIGARTGWAAIALALGRDDRYVTSFGRAATVRPEPYATLVDPRVRDRISFLEGPVDDDALAAPADLVLVDALTNDAEGLAALAGGEHVVRPGGVMLVRGHLRPEMRAAIKKLRLEGSVADSVYVWRKPLEAEGTAAPFEIVRPRLRLLAFAVAGSLLGGAAGFTEPLEESITDALQGQGGAGGNGSAGTELRQPPAPPAARTVTSGTREALSPSAPLAWRRAARPRGLKPGGIQSFSGVRDQKLGTVHVDGPTVVRWTADSGSLVIESETWSMRGAGKGSTVLSPGTYRGVGVKSNGTWQLTLRRPR
jgi:hypothetical protein